METFEEIIGRIAVQTGIDKKEVLLKVAEKRKELSNLISEEGAAYIVAKESGIELIKKKDYELKISSIIAGMKAVNVTARVLKVDEPRSFKTEKAEGKVCSLHIGDETGIMRLVLWNDQIGHSSELKRDNMIKITAAFVKDNAGRTELSLGKMGKLEKVQDSAAIPYADDIEKSFSASPTNLHISKPYERKSISGLREGERAEMRACLVQIFEGTMFFHTCPECGMKVQDKCSVHGKAEPNIIISGIADDGTGNIRAVFFRNAAEKIIGMPTADAWQIYEPRRNAEAIISRIPMAKDFVFKGFVKKNKLFDRLEFVVNEVAEMDVKKEIEMLIG